MELIEPEVSESFDPNAHIGKTQAEYLIARGYRRLAYAHLRDARDNPFGGAREETFAKTCRSHGVGDIRVLYLDITPGDAERALNELGETGYAVACYNDEVAMALLHAAHERGWLVPAELAVIGMDDTPQARVTIPPLTTMGYDPARITGARLDVRLVERASA